MTFSCSDFLDDVMRSLVHSQAITEADIPADDPGKAADVATAAIIAMHRAGLFARFMRELLNAVETLGTIAEAHGVDALVFLFDLQAAILNDTYIDAHAGIDGRIVELVSQLPSAAEWMKHLRNREATLVVVQPIPDIRVRADGDANFYHLLDGKDWVAAIQMNGKYTMRMQEAMLQKFAELLRNPSAHTCRS
ncbi:hypothetical protein BTH42_31800 [Burkholderia sp. SRS-W-2-2016]|uniref:hypothetical protein n=1 Tax=Burkholderia sp. SRS-W-2-2016 TaxID=1926878 RepID=UPI00094B239A|nr:hypothetical protein [Burkholderia sp. SRS-W-2-2016]OLL27619.1 hypothetical protein BTH42_31800 [Burkholderia sp. SRS-W-2-2016]